MQSSHFWKIFVLLMVVVGFAGGGLVAVELDNPDDPDDQDELYDSEERDNRVGSPEWNDVDDSERSATTSTTTTTTVRPSTHATQRPSAPPVAPYDGRESASTFLQHVLARLLKELETVNKQVEGVQTALVRLDQDLREEILALHDELQASKSAGAEVETNVQANGDTLERILEWTSQVDARFGRLDRAVAACRNGVKRPPEGAVGGGNSKLKKKKNPGKSQNVLADVVTTAGSAEFSSMVSDGIADRKLALLTKAEASSAAPAACDHLNCSATNELMQRVWKQLKSTCSPRPSSCAHVQMLGGVKNGVYAINPSMSGFDGYVRVSCDLQTDGGGWTVIQRRNDYGLPRENFSRSWSEYKAGFGDVQKEFWLGNDVIYALTNQEPVILRVELQNFEGDRRFAAYDHFRLETAQELFRLHLGAYRGDAADSLSRSRGMNFSTQDVDNDKWNGNCAKRFKGGWWFNNCHDANLNGFYHGGKHESYADGINWYHWKGFHYSLKRVEMKIRPLGFAEDGPQEVPPDA